MIQHRNRRRDRETNIMSGVTYAREGKVGVINWAKQPLNTYDGLTHYEVEEAWKAAAADDEANVVVFKAEGRHFCAGADTKSLEPRPADAPRFTPIDLWELERNLMKPTIAAVHGACVGGGQRMVFPCDLVFCTEDAFFLDPTAKLGIGGIQSHLHTWFYGPRLAKEMLFAGVPVPATRLYAMGTVNRLYPDVETLHRETLAFAHEIADADQLALRQAKRASNITMDIMGMHYIRSRFDELLDEFPVFQLRGGRS
jgi:enoyl-CoA hydratase/carnithine racemase